MLGIADAIGIDDDFFALGGDSLLALRVVNRLAGAGVTIQTKELFQLRTPRALEDVLATRVTAAQPSRQAVTAEPAAWHGLADDELARLRRRVPRRGAGRVAAVAAAAGCLLPVHLHRRRQHLPGAERLRLRPPARRRRDAYRRSVRCCRRHDNLRAGFTSEDLVRPVQYIGRFVPADVALVDLSDLTPEAADDRLAEVDARRRREPVRPAHAAAGPADRDPAARGAATGCC